MSDAELAARWPSLRARALVHDLGPGGRRVSAALDALERGMFVTESIPMEAGPTERAEPSTELDVAVSGTGESCTITFTGSATEPPVRCTATAAELRAAVPTPSGPAPRAVITMDPSAGHADFIRVVDILRAAGYTRFAISTRPARPR